MYNKLYSSLRNLFPKINKILADLSKLIKTNYRKTNQEKIKTQTKQKNINKNNLKLKLRKLIYHKIALF